MAVKYFFDFTTFRAIVPFSYITLLKFKNYTVFTFSTFPTILLSM
jgi:hypothetical protein